MGGLHKRLAPASSSAGAEHPGGTYFQPFCLQLDRNRVTDVQSARFKGADDGGICGIAVSALDQEALPSVMRKVFEMAAAVHLVPEMPHSRKDHGKAAVISGSNHLIITD